MRYKEKCGCTHDGTHWLKLCSPHAREAGELAARAKADRKREIPITVHRLNGKIVEP